MTSETVQFHSVTCCECGVLFAISEGHMKLVLRFGGKIACPNGHRNVFKPAAQVTEDESAKAECIRLKDQLRLARQEIVDLKGCVASLRHYEDMAQAKELEACPQDSDVKKRHQKTVKA